MIRHRFVANLALLEATTEVDGVVMNLDREQMLA
jgi:hypothetical protein